ncbi:MULTISPECIES: hypothetical protein [unclassified Bacillus cereus group]|uniref:hypothetical protein n=1 Tax=unclassified Bacillus cereus group TaxID=2750818 RepID=UPI001F594BEB|nr:MULTISPECIES: hypothetical protein [unclassified Bacillus cereus group]
MSVLINMLRRIVDKHDEKHGLRKREVFECTSLGRRNERRREAFRIPLEENQCPVFQDNRCCGSCDLSPTCDFATLCQCFGYEMGALGGTAKGYYMRDNENAKFGRIKDGEFDWDFFKMNKAKFSLKENPFVIREVDGEKKVCKYVNCNEEEKTIVLQVFSKDEIIEKEVIVEVKEIGYPISYETFEVAKYKMENLHY